MRQTINAMLEEGRERSLFISTVIAFFAVIVIQIELPVMSALQGTDFIRVFASKGFKDVASNLLVGFVSAYIFYVLIELVPRIKRERATLEALDMLLLSIVEAYSTYDFFAHSKPILWLDPKDLTLAVVNNCTLICKNKPDYQQLKCAMETAHSRYSDILQSLVLASSVSTEHTLIWLTITDKVRLLKEEFDRLPKSDKFEPSDVFYDKESEAKYDGDLFYRMYRQEMKDYRTTLQQRVLEYLVAVQEWLKLDAQKSFNHSATHEASDTPHQSS